MLTAEGCRQRRARLWAAFEEPPDWILLSEPRHLMYFANYSANPFIFRSQNASALLVLGPDETAVLVADNMLEKFAAQAHVSDVVAPTWYDGKGAAPERQAVLVEAALDTMQTRRGSRIGFDEAVPASVSLRLSETRPNLSATVVGPVARRLMRSKDADEIALLRRSMLAIEAGFAAAREHVHPGMTELQAYRVVQDAATGAAGEPVLVYGDLVSGPRTLEKGGPPSTRTIEAGDLFLLDYSVVIHGYRGDFANTWVIDSPATMRQREVAGVCLDAMAAAEALLKPDAPARSIDAAVRQVFERHGVLEHFLHHTGHGVGLGHPDPPYLTRDSRDALLAGDVLTIEPGLYIDDVGGMRFERNYLVTEDGFELLSHHQLGLDT
ncbi:MAG: aminopeptidase P family protein [Acidobacteria bacterium]|nr:aminopeptidase P family protein [Acidobacteriota bacterium]